jgi:hypothetical protein
MNQDNNINLQKLAKALITKLSIKEISQLCALYDEGGMGDLFYDHLYQYDAIHNTTTYKKDE